MKTQKYKVEIEMSNDDNISIDILRNGIIREIDRVCNGIFYRISIQKLHKSDDENTNGKESSQGVSD